MLERIGSRAFKAFTDRWEAQVRDAEGVFSDERSAHVIRVFLQEVRAMRLAELAIELSVAEAAAVSGYHQSSIWRMVADGDLEAVDEAGTTQVLATTLPLKVTGERKNEQSEGLKATAGESTPTLGAAALEPAND